MSQQFFLKYRELSLFIGGTLGIFHETVLATAERPTLLILFAAMMGLPAFLKPGDKDDKSKEK